MKLSKEAKEKLLIKLAPKVFEYVHRNNENYIASMMHKGFGGMVREYVDEIENAFLTVDEN